MTEITDKGRQRATDEPNSFDAMAVWREAHAACYNGAADNSAAATVIASAVAPLLAELAAVKAERDALRDSNARLRKHVADTANGINIVGSHYDNVTQSVAKP